MVNCLEMQGYASTEALQKFIGLMDKFFDCMNVQNTFSGKKSRKSALLPYESVHDWRFKVINIHKRNLLYQSRYLVSIVVEVEGLFCILI